MILQKKDSDRDENTYTLRVSHDYNYKSWLKTLQEVVEECKKDNTNEQTVVRCLNKIAWTREYINFTMLANKASKR